MTPDRKELADRILKLLALASSTTFEAEAETARRLADRLMQVHKIEVGSGKPSQDTIEIREFWTPSYAKFPPNEDGIVKSSNWHAIIVDKLCQFCSCTYVYWGEHLHYKFIGTIGNLDMLEYMLSQIDEQRHRAWLTHKRLEDHDSFHRFCYAYAQSLEQKIDRIIDHVLVSKTRVALMTWYEGQFGQISYSEKSLRLGRASSEAGLAAGKDASLHRGTLGQSYKQITKR